MTPMPKVKARISAPQCKGSSDGQACIVARYVKENEHKSVNHIVRSFKMHVELTLTLIGICSELFGAVPSSPGNLCNKGRLAHDVQCLWKRFEPHKEMFWPTNKELAR